MGRYGDLFLKALKIILLSFLAIFACIYLAFLLILPHSIDINKYAPQITKTIQDNTGLTVKLSDLTITTGWNLSAGASIKKTDLSYPTGEKFAQINNLQVKLSLLPLFTKHIKIDSINSDKILMNLDVAPDGDFLLNKYLKPQKLKANTQGFILSSRMPKISADKYRFTFVDMKSARDYTLKGKDLKISDFILNEKIKVKTDGSLYLNERKQISYNISILSTLLPQSKTKASDIIKTFEDIYKYKIRAKIKADLSIKNSKDDSDDSYDSYDSDINGKIDLDKISFVFANKLFPESTLKLNFKGNKAKINASLHADENSNALITGVFNTGRSKLIDLHVSSERIKIEDVLLIAKAMSKPLGIKGLGNITASGIIKADFDLKSNFKKIESNGYLKIKNASVNNKLYKVLVNSINADVDFSQNSVHIKQAKANINGQPIKVNGVIDKNAFANISILAQNLQLKGILLTSGQTKILKENNILGGTVNVKGNIKGRLDKANLIISATIANAKIKNKASKATIELPKGIISIVKDRGTAQVFGLKIKTANNPANNPTISIPKLTLISAKDNLIIARNYLYIDNIKTILTGTITNLKKNPELKNVIVSIPNQISVPIKGYSGSRIILKGDININGNLYKPIIRGGFNVPLISIPSTSTIIRNTSLILDKDVKINCPNIKVANSLIQLNAIANRAFSNGLVVKNVNLTADTFDLNYLAPLLKNLPNGNGSTLTILSGKSRIKRFKAGNLIGTNITTNISAKNNIFYINNVFADAYLGKIAGDINYNIGHRKININMQGRGLSSNPALVAITGQDDDIHGRLDFDSKISMAGNSTSDLVHSLNGYTNFIISNGKMGILGKFEHLLYAQNIVANNIFRANLGLAAKALTVKNTGVYRYMKGKIAFNNGWAILKTVKTSGPYMSLYVTGRCYLPTSTADLTILGRISDDVVRILGPIGEFSVDKAISYIPKIGEITAFFANQFTTNPYYENISQIPDLTPKTEFKTKEFKVIIDGDIRRQTSVKSFKWLARPRIVHTYQQSQQKQYTSPNTPTVPKTNLPDFVKKIPNYKG